MRQQNPVRLTGSENFGCSVSYLAWDRSTLTPRFVALTRLRRSLGASRMVSQFRKLLGTVDPRELTAEDQQALLDLFQAARQAQSSGGGRPCPGVSYGVAG